MNKRKKDKKLEWNVSCENYLNFVINITGYINSCDVLTPYPGEGICRWNKNEAVESCEV